MDKCLVYGCPNSLAENDSTVQLYDFPKQSLIAQQWLNACCIWNPEEVDLTTARICSIHFDEDNYTSEYKMVDYVGYARVLKYDAVPTLYLPQQAIVYRLTNVEEHNFPDENYATGSVIIENIQNQQCDQEIDEPREDCVEELLSDPLQEEEAEVQADIPEKYKHVKSHWQLEDIKEKNELMKQEIVKLGRSVRCLKKSLDAKIDEYKTRNIEHNILLETLSNLETKSMPLSEQKQLLSKVFSESQIKILSGKKKIYWSHDDMAVAYTIRHMSSKRCYVYLSKKLNIPLPGLSSIKRWQSSKKVGMVNDQKKSEKSDKNEDSDDIL